MSQDPESLLTSYVRAFESLDPQAVVPFFQLPCTFIRPDGTWLVSDPETAMVLVTHLIEHAKSQGYARTEVSGLATKRLAAQLALLTGVFVRHDATGVEIGRFGFTYVVRGGEHGWQIVVAMAHDPV